MAYRALEALWCRLVDVGGALVGAELPGRRAGRARRGDEFCPWNEGCWEVSADGVEQTNAKPDLRLGVDMLGSVYLGGFSFADLARAGRVEELRDGGLARADALFATDRHPWCPEIF